MIKIVYKQKENTMIKVTIAVLAALVVGFGLYHIESATTDVEPAVLPALTTPLVVANDAIDVGATIVLDKH